MPNGGKRLGAGRKPAGRVSRKVRMKGDSWERLDKLRRGKPRGVYLEKLLDSQQLSPFEKYLSSQKQ